MCLPEKENYTYLSPCGSHIYNLLYYIIVSLFSRSRRECEIRDETRGVVEKFIVPFFLFPLPPLFNVSRVRRERAVSKDDDDEFSRRMLEICRNRSPAEYDEASRAFSRDRDPFLPLNPVSPSPFLLLLFPYPPPPHSTPSRHRHRRRRASPRAARGLVAFISAGYIRKSRSANYLVSSSHLKGRDKLPRPTREFAS